MTAQAMGLGLLGCFGFVLLHHTRAGTPAHALWLCHLANLTAGLALLLPSPALLRFSVPWQLAGLGPWTYDMLMTREVIPASVVSHLGGAAVGLISLRRVGAGRWAWLHALVFFLLVQAACRAFTLPALNVNLAHAAMHGWEDWFPSYWQYWLATTSLTAAALFATGRVLLSLAPEPEGSPHA